MRNIKPNIVLIFTIFICLNNFYFSQNQAVLFNVRSGLPSNSVYDCAESNTGKMWITTDKGLAVYDGYTFKKVDLSDGLTTLFSWGFSKDSKGRLWLKNRQSPFTYIYNDSIYKVGGDKITDIHFDYLNEDEEGNIYISSHRFNKTHRIDTLNRVTTIDSVLISINSKNKKIWENNPLRKDKYVEIITHGDYVISVVRNTHNSLSSIETWNTLTNKKEKNSFELLTHLQQLSSLDQNHVLISCSKGVFKFNIETKKVTPYSPSFNTKHKNVVAVYTDRFGNKWFCDHLNGIWIEKATATYMSYHELDTTITYSSKASKDIIKLTTAGKYNYTLDGKGRRYVNKNHFIPDFLSTNTFIATSFMGLDLEMTNEGKAFLFEKNAHKTVDLPFDKWIDRTKGTGYSFKSGPYKCHYNSDSLFIIGTSAGVYTILLNKNQLRVEKNLNSFVFDVKVVGSSIYTVGLQGLNKIDLKTKAISLINNDPNLVNICIGEKYLYARKEDGNILKIDLNTLKPQKIISTYKDVQKIVMVNDEIWGIGESKILLFDNNTLDVKQEINQFDGVIAPNKIGIEKLGDNYYLICENGYYKFNRTKIKRNYLDDRINFEIESAYINGERSYGKDILLKKDINHLEINLRCIYFPFSKENFIFYYRLKNGDWIKTEQPNISIMSLPFGKYDLEIKAKFKGSNTFFHRTLKLDINNPKPFHKSLTFMILVFILLLVTITSISVYKRKRKVSKLNQQFNIAQNRMKMLVMQMKPHFLSNAFNSLQSSFIEDDTIRSSQIIKDLDNYLRLSLTYSKKDVVSLYSEITLAKQYLQIEQNRLVKKVELIIGDKLKHTMGNIHVPVFILQPIIENAIWHGIQKSTKDYGVIIIDGIEDEDNYCIITVEDNGIGVGKSNHKGNSVALENINERLSLIDNNKRKQYLFIEPTIDGTKVKLYVTKTIKNYPH